MRKIILCAAVGMAIGLTSCGEDKSEPVVPKPVQEGAQLMNPPTDRPKGVPTPRPDSLREDVLLVEPHFTAVSESLVTEFTTTALQQMNEKYAGKVVEVSGTICFVDRITYPNGIDHGAIYVNLCPTATYQPKTVRCEFVMDSVYSYTGHQTRMLVVDGVDTLSRGAEVVIRGYYKHIGPRDFRMDECRLIRP